jgi:hypothetical protein
MAMRAEQRRIGSNIEKSASHNMWQPPGRC